MFHDLVDDPTFSDINVFYTLNQTTIIGLMLQRYGGTTLKKIKTDDQFHVADIAITDSNVCAYLPDMMTSHSIAIDLVSLRGYVYFTKNLMILK